MARKKTVKAIRYNLVVSENESLSAKADMVNHHTAKVTKVYRLFEQAGKNALTRNIELGEALFNMHSDLRVWKVKWKDIYQAVGLDKTTCDRSLKLYRNRDKIAEAGCKTQAEALKVAYGKGNGNGGNGENGNGNGGNGNGKGGKKRSPEKLQADILKGIATLADDGNLQLLLEIKSKLAFQIENLEKLQDAMKLEKRA